jgi:hypothetical protein
MFHQGLHEPTRAHSGLGDVRKAGAFADIVVVDGNPLKDLTLLQDQGRHLAAIMKGGWFYKNSLHESARRSAPVSRQQQGTKPK